MLALTLVVFSSMALAQGGFSAPPDGMTVKMGKPDPQKAKEFKAKREKLLKDLKLTPAQKKSWDAIETKNKALRQKLIQKLQSGSGDMMGSIQKLQALGENEKKEKMAILSPAQKKIMAAAPGGGATSIQTIKG